MVKELIYTFKSDTEVEILIDRLEEILDIRKASHDEGLGYSLRNNDSSLEVHVVPKVQGESFEVVVKTGNEHIENISREVFGEPIREVVKDASILDVAEFLITLPENLSKDEMYSLLKEKFSLNEEKLQLFRKMIIKQASKFNSRDYLKAAAKKLK